MTYCRTSQKTRRILRSGALATLVALLPGFLSAAQPPCPSFLALHDEPKVTIGWAAKGWGNQNYLNSETQHVERAPDGKSTYVSGSVWLVTATFNQKVTYEKLAAALDLTANDLKTYDIIAFEGNSDTAGIKNFENSIWFVTDSTVWASGTFLRAGPVPAQQLKFRTGSLCVEDYKKIFGVKELQKDNNGKDITAVGWILVDIPDTMKMDLDHLKIFLTGVRLPNPGSPEPDAIGLIVH